MKTTILLALCLVLASTVAPAQNRMGQGRPGQRIEQFRKLRMIEALKLDDDTSVKFFTKYNKHEDAVRDINEERNGLLDQLQGLRKTDAADAELNKVIQKLEDLDRKLVEERTRYLEDIRSVLTTRQMADLFLFERNFTRNVRQLMQEMTQERRRGQN